MGKVEDAVSKDLKEKKLKQKMAQSVSGTSPSMVPAGIGNVPLPPPKEDETPSIDDLIGDAEERETLRKLVANRISYDLAIKPLEKMKDATTDRIKTILGSYGINKASCDGASLSYTQTERKTINRVKLEALGVDPAIIDTATDVTTSAMLRITQAKG